LPRPSRVKNLLHNRGFEQSLDGWDFDTGIFWSANGGSKGSGLLLNSPEVISESKRIHVSELTPRLGVVQKTLALFIQLMTRVSTHYYYGIASTFRAY